MGKTHGLSQSECEEGVLNGIIKIEGKSFPCVVQELLLQ